MNIKIITVGKLKEKYLKQGIAEYTKRLGSYCKLQIIEVNDEKAPENLSEKEMEMVKDKEGERILAKVTDQSYVFALAINGKQYDSVDFAKTIEQLGISGKKGSFVDVEIFCQDSSLASEYQSLAQKLRERGINVEVFPENKKIGQQYAVTDKKGIKWGILMSAQEAEQKKFTLKNLETRQMFSDVDADKAAEIIRG